MCSYSTAFEDRAGSITFTPLPSVDDFIGSRNSVAPRSTVNAVPGQGVFTPFL